MPIQQKDPTPKPPQKKNRLCTQIAVVDHEAATWRPGEKMGGLQERLLRFVILRYGPQVRMEKPMGKNHGKKKKKTWYYCGFTKKKMAEKNDPHNQILSL